MTENGAKSCVQGKLDCMNKCDVFNCKGTDECENCNYCYSQGNFGEQKKAFEMAIQALEEIQEFRKQGITIEKALDTMCDLAGAESVIEQYRAIGTVEEFKALKEKAEPKAIEWDNWVSRCPCCGTPTLMNDAYCRRCGTKLGWS